MATRSKGGENLIERREPVPPAKRTVKGWYTVLALSYGRNGTVETWVKIGGRRYRDKKTGSGNIRAEILKIGHTGWKWTWFGPRRKRVKIEAQAYAKVKSVPAEAGPWYHRERGDPTHVRIFDGIADAARLLGID